MGDQSTNDFLVTIMFSLDLDILRSKQVNTALFLMSLLDLSWNFTEVDVFIIVDYITEFFNMSHKCYFKRCNC